MLELSCVATELRQQLGGLKSTWFVHERPRTALIVELRRQHFAVPWGCPHPPILGPSGLRVVDLPQTRARARAKPRALRASGGGASCRLECLGVSVALRCSTREWCRAEQQQHAKEQLGKKKANRKHALDRQPARLHFFSRCTDSVVRERL